MKEEDRLIKRLWLQDNYDKLFEELVYHKAHLEEFALDYLPLWEWDKEEGSIAIT